MREFAKTFLIDDRQVLAFLLFDQDAEFVMVVQWWDDAEDHQVQACISFPSLEEDKVWERFSLLTEDNVRAIIEDAIVGIEE